MSQFDFTRASFDINSASKIFEYILLRYGFPFSLIFRQSSIFILDLCREEIVSGETTTNLPMKLILSY